MESNGRRRSRGFMKGKQLMMSIYRGTNNYRSTSSNKVKPTPPVSQLVNQPKQDHHNHHVEFIVNQEQVVPHHQQKQKVSFLFPSDQVVGGSGGGSGDQYSYGVLHDNINKLYSAVAVDESVDIKAATYISSVRERLRLHRVNAEHKKLQDMQLKP